MYFHFADAEHKAPHFNTAHKIKRDTKNFIVTKPETAARLPNSEDRKMNSVDWKELSPVCTICAARKEQDPLGIHVYPKQK